MIKRAFDANRVVADPGLDVPSVRLPRTPKSGGRTTQKRPSAFVIVSQTDTS